jgi:hypothetical protein
MKLFMWRQIMVSANTPGPEIVDTGVSSRGFVAQTAPPPLPIRAPAWIENYPYFWGSVVAGAVVAMAITALSEALMFGCHVGTNSNGDINFGGGAAVWIILTSCVAFFFGGWVAGCFGIANRSGLLRGLTVWGLSVPLSVALGSVISAGAGLAYVHTSQLAEQITNNTGSANLAQGQMFVNYGGAWTAFFALLGGLIFAIIGSAAAQMTDQVSATIGEEP